MRLLGSPAIFPTRCVVDKSGNVTAKLRHLNTLKPAVSGATVRLVPFVFLLPHIPSLDIFICAHVVTFDTDGCVLSMTFRKHGRANRFLNIPGNDD